MVLVCHQRGEVEGILAAEENAGPVGRVSLDTARSSAESLPGLLRMSSGIRILPRSCSSPAMPIFRTDSRDTPMNSPSAIDSTDTFMACVVVY